MYKEVTTNYEILTQLEKSHNSNEDLVIHYICANCGDEQTTGFIEIDENMLSHWKRNASIMVSFECTNCAVSTLYLDLNNIIAFEDDTD